MGALNAQPVHDRKIGVRVGPGQLQRVATLIARAIDDLVVNIGKVLRVGDLVPEEFEPAAQDVNHYEHPGRAQY